MTVEDAFLTQGDLDLREYRRGLLQGELRFPRCDECGDALWPPRPQCPRCGSAVLTWHAVPRDGRLFTWTVVARTHLPEFTDRVPYAAGIIEIPDIGIRMMGFVDADPAVLVMAQVLTWTVLRNADGLPRVRWRPEAGGRHE